MQKNLTNMRPVGRFARPVQLFSQVSESNKEQCMGRETGGIHMYMYSGNTNGLMYMYLDLSIFKLTIKRPMGPITHMDASVFNFV